MSELSPLISTIEYYTSVPILIIAFIVYILVLFVLIAQVRYIYEQYPPQNTNSHFSFLHPSYLRHTWKRGDSQRTQNLEGQYKSKTSRTSKKRRHPGDRHLIETPLRWEMLTGTGSRLSSYLGFRLIENRLYI